MGKWYQKVLKGLAQQAPALGGAVGGLFGPLGGTIGQTVGSVAAQFGESESLPVVYRGMPVTQSVRTIRLPAPTQDPTMFLPALPAIGGNGGGSFGPAPSPVPSSGLPVWIAIGVVGLLGVAVIVRR